jgi:hypothetical protein
VLLALPGTVLAQTVTTETHDTFLIQFEVFDNGFLGESANFGDTPGAGGFFFGGVFGLFEGQFLVGLSSTKVCGEAYAGSAGQEGANWVNTQAFSDITTFEAPYEEFDEGYSVGFDCSGDPNPDPAPIEVVERSYSDTGDPFVVLEFQVFNEGATDLTGVYTGLFSDLDVGDFVNNFGDFDDGTDLLYVWDNSATNPNYYGMMALNVGDNPGADVSGVAFDAGAGANPTQDLMWAAMTSGVEPPPAAVADRRTVLATGPYDIPAGGSIVVQFAYVAGLDEAGIIANAGTANTKVDFIPVPLAIEPNPDGTPGTHALGEVFPNPFSANARVSLEVAQTQDVRLAVYDALGREVAVLHEGALSSGRNHTFELSAASLPSGVYLVRAAGETFVDTRQVTVTR